MDLVISQVLSLSVRGTQTARAHEAAHRQLTCDIALVVFSHAVPGGSAEASGLLQHGDVLIEVDNIDVYCRPGARALRVPCAAERSRPARL